MVFGDDIRKNKMDISQSQIVSFIWGIADDSLDEGAILDIRSAGVERGRNGFRKNKSMEIGI